MSKKNRKTIDNALVEEAYKKTSAACEQYGYECLRVFDEIHINTHYERWFFIPGKEKTRLLHSGMAGRSGTEHHEQFKKEITPEEIVEYVHKHETAKYTPKFVKFSDEER